MWLNWEGKVDTQFAKSTVMQTFLTTIKKQNKQTKITVTTNSQNIM